MIQLVFILSIQHISSLPYLSAELYLSSCC